MFPVPTLTPTPKPAYPRSVMARAHVLKFRVLNARTIKGGTVMYEVSCSLNHTLSEMSGAELQFTVGCPKCKKLGTASTPSSRRSAAAASSSSSSSSAGRRPVTAERHRQRQPKPRLVPRTPDCRVPTWFDPSGTDSSDVMREKAFRALSVFIDDDPPNPYQMLCLDPSTLPVTAASIKANYRYLMRLLHPDKLATERPEWKVQATRVVQRLTDAKVKLLELVGPTPPPPSASS